MIVPVLLKIDAKLERDEDSLDGVNTIKRLVERTYSLRATALDLDTGDLRTYVFRSMRPSEPGYNDVGEMSVGRLELDERMRQLRAGLDRWLGDALVDPIDLERVKSFVRQADSKTLGAVMGTCLSTFDQRADSDIVTLLRQLTVMVERMVADFAAQGEEQ